MILVLKYTVNLINKQKKTARKYFSDSLFIFSTITVSRKETLFCKTTFEQIKKIMKLKILLLIALITLINCTKKSKEAPKIVPKQHEVITADDIETITPTEAKTYHKDTQFQYEYRTGTSGDYEYNYDVTGTDENGEKVSGNINTEGKFGAGKLINSKGFKIDIQTEWVDQGKLKAIDKKGTIYQLIVN